MASRVLLVARSSVGGGGRGGRRERSAISPRDGMVSGYSGLDLCIPYHSSQSEHTGATKSIFLLSRWEMMLEVRGIQNHESLICT